MPSDINQQVLAIAERWIGTPYRHQGSNCQVGCDCLGLIRGIWREIYGVEPEATPPYSRTWAETTKEEPLLAACERWFHPVALDAPIIAGMVLVFRWQQGSAAKHLGLASSHDHFIHAYSGQAVVQSALVPSWRRRIVGRYTFPTHPPANLKV